MRNSRLDGNEAVWVPRERVSPGQVVRDLRWVVADCFRWFGRRATLAVGLGIMAQVAQAGTIIVALRLFVAVERGEAISAGPVIIDLRESVATLALVTASLFLLVVVSALLQWWSKALIASVVRLYEEACSRRALQGVGSVPTSAWLAEDEGVTSERALLRLVTRDTRYCGRVVNEVLQAFAPALTAVVALGVLIWLAWLPTLVMAVVILAVWPLYVRVNHRGMQSMRGIERLARMDAALKNRAIQDSMSTPLPATRMVPDTLGDPRAQAYLDAYEVRLRTAHSSLLVGNVLFAASVCAVLLLYGLMVLEGGGFSVTILVYVFGLQYLAFSLRSLGKHMTNVHVFHPSFGRVVRFMRADGMAPTGLVTGDEEEERAPVEVCAVEPWEGSMRSCELRPDRPVSVVVDFGLTRPEMRDLLEALMPEQEGRVARAIGNAAIVQSDGLYELLSAGEEERLKSELPAPQERFLRNLRTAMEYEPSWVFMNAKHSKKLNEDEWSAVLGREPGCFLVHVYTYVPDRIRAAMGAQLIVVRDGAVRFIGPVGEYASLRPRLAADDRQRGEASQVDSVADPSLDADDSLIDAV